MIEVEVFEPARHDVAWRKFIEKSYANRDYVLLSRCFFDWQFLHNPANETGRHTFWVIRQRDRIIGQLGIVPFVGKHVSGAFFRGAYPINLMIDPEYQSFGLGAVLMKQLSSSYEGIINSGSSRAGADVSIALGMTDFGPLPRHVFVLNGTQAVPFHAAQIEMDKSLCPLSPAESFELLQSLPIEFSLPRRNAVTGADRSLDYLTWRYGNHPVFKYEYLFDRESSAMVIFRQEKEATTGLTLIRVVELLGERGIIGSLLAVLVLYAEDKEVVLIDAYCSDAQMILALSDAGFEYENPDLPGFATLFNPLDHRRSHIHVLAACHGHDVGAFSSWYVTRGDSDQDRPSSALSIQACLD